MVGQTQALFLILLFTFVNAALANKGEASDPAAKDAEKGNYALYTFSAQGRGGMHHGYNAGSYVTLEVSQDKKDAQRVNFRITNLIPEPWSRIGSIGFDLGRHTNLFSRLETDKWIGQHYRLTHFSEPYTHAFWPDFNASYYLASALDPRIAKPKDPRRLSPGSSLTITATLYPGVRYEDVIAALNQGLTSRDGLRVAIIGLHLAGQPLPGGTRMDDGGYFTGRLVRASGPHVSSSALTEPAHHSVRSDERKAKPDNSNTGIDDKQVQSDTRHQVAEPEKKSGLTQTSTDTDKPAVPSGDSTEKNPQQTPARSRNSWCRFCPDTGEK